MTYRDYDEWEEGMSEQERAGNSCNQCGEFVGWKNLKDGVCKICRSKQDGSFEYESDKR